MKRFKVRLYEGGLTSSNQTAVEYIISAEDLSSAIKQALNKYHGSLVVYCAEAGEDEPTTSDRWWRKQPKTEGEK